jgi:hypothetical protein
MRFAEPGKLMREVESAGFRDVHETVVSFPAPLKLDPEGVLTFLLEVAAPFKNAVESLPVAVRHEAEQEVIAGLRTMYDGAQTMMNAPVVIVTGVK